MYGELLAHLCVHEHLCVLAHVCMKSSCLTPRSQAGWWGMGPDTHLRALLGLGMLSWGLETCILLRAHPSLVPTLASTASAMPGAGEYSSCLLVLSILCSKQGWEMVSGSLEHPHHSPHTFEAPAFIPARGRIAVRLMGIGGAQALLQAGCSPIPNCSGRCFCSTLHLQPHWMAWESPVSCRPPSNQRRKDTAPTAPGRVIAAARGCRKC